MNTYKEPTGRENYEAEWCSLIWFSRNDKGHKRSTSKTEMLNLDKQCTVYKVELNYIFMENSIPAEDWET